MALFDSRQGLNGNGEGNGVHVSSAAQAAINAKSKQEKDPNYGKPGYVWREDLQRMVPEYMATPTKTVPKPATPAVNSQLERAKATDPNRNNPNYEWNDAQAKYVRITASRNQDFVDEAKEDKSQGDVGATPEVAVPPGAQATDPKEGLEGYAKNIFSGNWEEIPPLPAGRDPNTWEFNTNAWQWVEKTGRSVTETVLGAEDTIAENSKAGEESFTTDPATLLPEVVTPSTRDLAESYEELDSKGATKTDSPSYEDLDSATDTTEETTATADPNEGRAGFYKHPFSGRWEMPPSNPFGAGAQFDSTTWKWVKQPWVPKPEGNEESEIGSDYYTRPEDLIPEGEEVDLTKVETGRRVVEENGRNIQIIEYSTGEVERTDIGESESARIAREENEAAEAKRLKEEKDVADREALMEGYREQALSGELTPEAIKALNLGQGASTALVQLYQQGAEKRNAAETAFNDNMAKAGSGFIDLAGIEALGLDPQRTQLLKNAYNEGVREREGAAAAAETERVNSEIERYKQILRTSPDADININKIFADDPEVAKALNTWMGGDEYTKLTTQAGLGGGGEETTESFLSRMPAVPADMNNESAVAWLGQQGNISQEDMDRWYAWAQRTNRTATVTDDDDGEDVSYEELDSAGADGELDEDGRPPKPTHGPDGKPIDIDYLVTQGMVHADEPWAWYSSADFPYLNIPEPGRWEPNYIISTGPTEPGVSIGPDGEPIDLSKGLAPKPFEGDPFGRGLPGEEEVEETTETRESFLARMPSVPSDMNNEEAVYWLSDQEGVTAEDAQRWRDWANQTGRKATEPVETEEEILARFGEVTTDLPPGTIRNLIEEKGYTEDQVRTAGRLMALGEELDFIDGQKAFNGYSYAVAEGTGQEWIDNFTEMLNARGVDMEGQALVIDSLYQIGSEENAAAIAGINMEDLMLRLPEPPVEMESPADKWFWMLDQVDAEGNPVLNEIESMAYYQHLKTEYEAVNAETSVAGKGGLGDASDPANLESIQTTIANEIEKVVQDMGFNSDEYKETQTTALEDRYQDARVRLGRQFGIDPGGPKTGRAQRSFEILESERIQDLSALDSEVQDRVQAARDSTITNLVNAFSSITTGKISEAQLDEQQRQFNTELRESVRQFNKDIALRLKEFGLNETEVEAAIKKINSDIVNNTRAISADISQAWAEVTGEVSVPGGVLSLEDLGVPESDWAMFPYLPPSEDTKNSIRMSFEAMLGREMTEGEMTSLLANGKLKVDDNMPTQRAKEFAATLMQQNMDRVSRYDAIAEEKQLDRDKFTEAKDQADKEWRRVNLQVAEEFGLDNNMFRNSMWDLDQRLSKIFFNEDYTEVERDRARRGAINDVARAYFPDSQGAFLQAKDQYDVLYGDRERAVANAFGMDAETFSRANRQADQQEQRYLDVWTSLLADVEPVKIPAQAEYNFADNAPAEMDNKERFGWLTSRIKAVAPIAGKIKFELDKNNPGGFTEETDTSWEGELNQYYLAGLNEVFLQVDGMDEFMSPVEVEVGGIAISIPGGRGFSPDQAVDSFFNNASNEQLNKMEDAFLAKLPTTAIQTDGDLRRNLRAYLQAVSEAPEGEGPAPFAIQYTEGDWFGKQPQEIQSAVMSLLGTTNFSPERAQGGGSALRSIGALLGAGIGAYAGFQAGGPAGIVPGANTGADVVGSVL